MLSEAFLKVLDAGLDGKPVATFESGRMFVSVLLAVRKERICNVLPSTTQHSTQHN